MSDPFTLRLHPSTDITEDEIALLEECQTEEDWNFACDVVKQNRGGHVYPPDWFDKVRQSGMMARILARWGGPRLTVKPVTINDLLRDD